MHTLATPAVPSLVSWNPVMNVVAFYTLKGNVSLYRRNGELVWSMPTRKQTGAVRLIWSPNGQNLAIIYSDGLYQILKEQTGKNIQIVANSNASTLAWATSQPPASDDVMDFFPAVVNFREELILAVGKRSGNVSIILDGYLSIGELELGNAAIQEIFVSPNQDEYSVLNENTVYTIEASYLSRYSAQQIKELIIKPAKLQSLCQELKTIDAKYTQEQQQYSQLLTSVFESFEDPVVPLYNAVLTLVPDESLSRWIEETHEIGFKRWAKDANAYYISSRKLLLGAYIPLVQQIIIYLGDTHLENNQHHLEQAREKIKKLLIFLFDLVHRVTEQQKYWESFSAVVQQLFSLSLDRNIQIVDKDVVEGANSVAAAKFVTQTVANPQILATPPDALSFKEEFQTAISYLQNELHAQLLVTQTQEFAGKLISAQKIGKTLYLIFDDMGYSLVVWESKTVLHKKLSTDAVCCRIFGDVLGVLEPRNVSLFNLQDPTSPFATVDLNYAASGFTYRDGLLCVLTEDEIHFEIIDIAI